MGELTYFGTLNTAIRLSPRLIVVRSVPTNTRLSPWVVASRQPFPVVMRSPRLAFLPEI